jgi:NAD(P)-dependent dehydrogenase (short-subunit alcohol dehydrogenase family)
MPLPSFTKVYHHEPYPSIDPTRKELSARGKVVLIAGGGSGVGAASAAVFAKAGARAVAILGRRKDSLMQTSEIVKESNPSTVVEIYSLDIVDEMKVASCFAHFVKTHGPIDICINSAAYLSDKATIRDGSVEDFWASFEIGIKGAFILAQHFLRNCSRTGAVMVGVNSLIAHMPASQVDAAPASYASNKIAAAKLYEYVAAENPHIRCYSIHPGVIETDMAKKSADMMPPGPNPFLPWDSGTSTSRLSCERES